MLDRYIPRSQFQVELYDIMTENVSCLARREVILACQMMKLRLNVTFIALHF